MNTCVRCRAELLPAVEPGETNGDRLRCPSCGADYERIE